MPVKRALSPAALLKKIEGKVPADWFTEDFTLIREMIGKPNVLGKSQVKGIATYLKENLGTLLSKRKPLDEADRLAFQAVLKGAGDQVRTLQGAAPSEGMAAILSGLEDNPETAEQAKARVAEAEPKTRKARKPTNVQKVVKRKTGHKMADAIGTTKVRPPSRAKTRKRPRPAAPTSVTARSDAAAKARGSSLMEELLRGKEAAPSPPPTPTQPALGTAPGGPTATGTAEAGAVTEAATGAGTGAKGSRLGRFAKGALGVAKKHPFLTLGGLGLGAMLLGGGSDDAVGAEEPPTAEQILWKRQMQRDVSDLQDAQVRIRRRDPQLYQAMLQMAAGIKPVGFDMTENEVKIGGSTRPVKEEDASPQMLQAILEGLQGR